ncbi:MAG TPA: hypothetical protein VLF87_02225 [Patescibacteria group bacterium]|nr:hypothetical protein [Patescibacteria group bacterium]
MSEFSPRHEHSRSHEKVVNPEQHDRAEQARKEAAEQARAAKSAENIALLKELAAKQAAEADKVKIETEAEPADDNPIGLQHDLKATAYRRTLKSVQKKLPAPVRSFSKVVHSNMVDKASVIGAQTIARPSGILGGSLFALLGSGVLFYYSRHYGFRYNYLLAFILFIGGYALGSALELLVWLTYSRRQRY